MSQYTHGWSNVPPLPPLAITPTSQPQSPTAGAWTFTCAGETNASGGNEQQSYVWQVGTNPVSVLRNGTFADRQSATNAMLAKCFGSPPSGASPTVPAGGGAPGGIGTGPAGIGWWVVCNPGGQIVVVPGTSQQQAITIAGGSGVVAAGPFKTQDDAQTQVSLGAVTCGVKEECNIKSLIDCATLPKLISGIGSPGTPEWCRAMDLAVVEVGAVGVALFKFLDTVLNYKDHIENMDAYISGNITSPVSVGIVKVIREIFCWLAPFAETMRQVINCARGWLNTLFPKCNNEAEWGLIIIRSFLLSLERIEWGTDAAIWIVATSGIAIDPITRTVEYLIRYACPVELVSEGEAVEAYKYSTVDESIIRCVMAAHGKQLDAIKPYLEARGDKPSWREAIQYARRIGLSEDSVEPILRHLGVLNEGYRAALHELYDELPSIGDHLEWLRKNVFDEAYVKDFRLDEGFEDRFWARFGSDLRALGMKKENARLHYAAHWINPSFTQQFEMVQRLRPGRVDPSLQFSRDDLLRTMQEMDVGVYFRERLERISHPIPNLTLCLQMYQFGTVADTEFVEMLKDLGFDDTNAGKILAAQVIKVRRLNASSGHGWTPTSLASAYAVGKLTPQQISDEMSFLGYSQDASDRLMRRAEIELASSPIRRIQQQSIRSALATQEKAYKCGAISATQLVGVYTNAGIPERIGQIAAANVDSEVAVGLCGQQIATFRSALLKGKATVDQIRELMLNSGIPLLRVEQYMKGWVIEAQLKGPSATAAQILRWVGTGLLDSETASARLLNLGWTNPDLTLLLAESSAKLSRYQQAVQNQAARSQQAAAKAALALAREADATAKKLRSALRGVASISTLTKWFKDGLIDEATFTEYAEARGYPAEYTARYLAEAIAARAKAKKPPAAKSTPGNPINGTA